MPFRINHFEILIPPNAWIGKSAIFGVDFRLPPDGAGICSPVSRGSFKTANKILQIRQESRFACLLESITSHF
jgi:hypothetical protein